MEMRPSFVRDLYRRFLLRFHGDLVSHWGLEALQQELWVIYANTACSFHWRSFQNHNQIAVKTQTVLDHILKKMPLKSRHKSHENCLYKEPFTGSLHKQCSTVYIGDVYVNVCSVLVLRPHWRAMYAGNFFSAISNHLCETEFSSFHCNFKYYVAVQGGGKTA